jgi:hypothetical protein
MDLTVAIAGSGVALIDSYGPFVFTKMVQWQAIAIIEEDEEQLARGALGGGRRPSEAGDRCRGLTA